LLVTNISLLYNYDIFFNLFEDHDNPSDTSNCYNYSFQAEIEPKYQLNVEIMHNIFLL